MPGILDRRSDVTPGGTNLIGRMRIVIVGAGAVGSYLAQRLSTEGQDVVMIESDARRAAQVQEDLDALVIHGNGASPKTLEEAGVRDADLLIAVSNNDGANVMACHAAAEVGAKRTVARVEDPGLREGLAGLNVDVVIDPGETAALELQGLVAQGGVSDLIEFGRGELVLVGGTAQPHAAIVGAQLSDLRKTINAFDWVVAAVVRNGQTIVAHGTTEILPDDHVLMMVTSNHLDDATELMGLRKRRISRIIILGTTRLAALTAGLMIEEGFDVVVIDPDEDRCREIADQYGKALVITGGPMDPRVLGDLGINHRDAVLALTGWDEVNVLGCLVAKALGASTAVSRVNRLELVNLLSDVGIDTVVSSRLAAANAILRFVRRGRIHSVATFKDTDAEAIEIEVDPASEAVGMNLLELPLSEGTVIGGILRAGDAFVPDGQTVISPRDRLILFALPKTIASVERLFSE